MRRLIHALVILPMLALATCADDTEIDAGAPEVTATSAATTITPDPVLEHPTGADQLVVQIRDEGGFLPVDRVFAEVPRVTLAGDGTLVVEGAQIEIFPPPALPPLFATDIGESGIEVVLLAAADAGLLGPPPDYGQPPIADATTTVVEIHANGETYVHEAYALMEAGTMGPGEETGPPSGLTAEQEDWREALAAFVALMTAPELELPVDAPEPQPYVPETVAFRATPVTDGEAPEGIDPEVVDWPLPDVLLATAAECEAVDGEAADTLLAVLAESSTATRFVQEGQAYTLAVRPLLPTEEGCDRLELT